MFLVEDYDYALPKSHIAQKPALQRDQSNLLYLNRISGEIFHHSFCDISDFLTLGDLLVINNTAVIPARLFGRKNTGGKVEVLLLDTPHSQAGSHRYRCLIKASRSPKPDTVIFFEESITARVADVQNGVYTLEFTAKENFTEVLHRMGHIPLPPYIHRQDVRADVDDRSAYQTVYASEDGAVAAPTAGLHFTKALLSRLSDKGVGIAEITLHVGYGTFFPVKCPDIRNHHMHSEWYSVSEESAYRINQVKAAGGRVVAVGTTCVRTLEYAANADGVVYSGTGHCDLFIYPGYGFRVVDALITNFHLPKSTLLMLVCAFAGREKVLNAYRQAIAGNYRFYSYGDAMFIA